MGYNRRSGLEFCCCAFPLVNAGAYVIIIETFLVALAVLVLALAPPAIVAATGSLPAGWPKYIVAIIALIIMLLQPIGLFAVIKQRPSLYRAYLRVATILVFAEIIVTLAFFAVAAARHSTALESCIALYANTPQGDGTGFSTSQTDNALDGVGDTICNVWIWIQVGLMGLLIALVGITQLYMLFAQRAYGQRQREAYLAHKSYNGGPHEGIPLAARESEVWGSAAGPEDYGSYPSHRGQASEAYASRNVGAGVGAGRNAYDDPGSPPQSPNGAASYDTAPYQHAAPYAQQQHGYMGGAYEHGSYDSQYAASGYGGYEPQEAHRRNDGAFGHHANI